MRRILPLVASALFLLCAIAVHPQTTCTSVKKIEDCPEAGCGGWDRQLNIKKNYTSDPKKQTPVNRSLEEIKMMKYPEQWFSGKDRGELEALGEGNLVRVKGYLVAVRYDDATSANCKLGDSQAISHRLMLVSEDALGLNFRGRELSSVSVFITPRVRRLHAELGPTKSGQKAWITNWTKWKLYSLIYAAPRTALLVRVTGLLLLNTERMYNPIRRFTDWEIHPVLEIDVCRKKDRCADGTGWEKLEKMKITEPRPPRPYVPEPSPFDLIPP